MFPVTECTINLTNVKTIQLIDVGKVKKEEQREICTYKIK